jgi:hypothetical protein
VNGVDDAGLDQKAIQAESRPSNRLAAESRASADGQQDGADHRAPNP